MTFSKFEVAVKQFRPDIHEVVNADVNKVFVVYKKNGRAYEYNGTYCQILNKLGINSMYKQDVEDLKKDLKRYEKEHGQLSDFWDDGYLNDWSVQIKEIKDKLDACQVIC